MNNSYLSQQNFEMMNNRIEELLIKSQELEISNQDLQKKLKVYKEENEQLKE